MKTVLNPDNKTSALEWLAKVQPNDLLELILDVAETAIVDGGDATATIGAVLADQPRLVISWEWPSELEVLDDGLRVYDQFLSDGHEMKK